MRRKFGIKWCFKSEPKDLTLGHTPKFLIIKVFFSLQWQPTITKWSSLLMLNKQAKFKNFRTFCVDVLPTTEELVKFTNDYMEADGVLNISGVRTEELMDHTSIKFSKIQFFY